MHLLTAPVGGLVAGIMVILASAPVSAIPTSSIAGRGTLLAEHDPLSTSGTRGQRQPSRAARTSSAKQTALLGTHPDEEVVWSGRRHRNTCIQMTDGTAIVKLLAGDASSDDPNGFEVYANEKYDTTSRPILDGRAIEIRTPSFPHYTGPVCLGIAPKAPEEQSDAPAFPRETTPP